MARFILNAAQWRNMLEYFIKNPKGLLTSEIVNKDGAGLDRSSPHSHCGVIVGQTNKYYKVKNSWGNGFAD